MASRGAASHKAAGFNPLARAALAGGGALAGGTAPCTTTPGGTAPCTPTGCTTGVAGKACTLDNLDLSMFTRVSPAPQMQRVALAAGAGVCLHRTARGFEVEIHAHDASGGYLLSMTQAEAARLAVRLTMFAQLVPGAPVEGWAE